MSKKVLIGMSGGVDSTVSALLLQKQGYEVIGCNMKLFSCEISTSGDAKDMCDSLNIPFYLLDLEKEFKKYIIDYFCDSYKNCLTPNPCVECNKYLKFGFMYQEAKKLGCDYIATGHYAKTEYSLKYNRNVICKANSIKKDQSYFLYNIDKEVIDHMLFPLADFESKDEIRNIAKKNNISVASKKDSEDICFIDGDYKEFLMINNFKDNPGNIVLKDGSIIGKHNGLFRYTIGQRKGLGISYSYPLFVIGFNKEQNELIVGSEDELYKNEIIVKDINLLAIDSIEDKMRVSVKIRYASKPASATLYNLDNKVKIVFDEKQKSPTSGQSAVFYDENILLGGGKIE